MKDLDKENCPRVVFNIDKFKRLLKDPPKPMRLLNFQIVMYISLNVPRYERIPSPGQIVRELNMDIKTVSEAITDLKDYGVLED